MFDCMLDGLTTESDQGQTDRHKYHYITGASPYPNIALADVYRLLCEGYRMLQPRNCSNEL